MCGGGGEATIIRERENMRKTGLNTKSAPAGKNKWKKGDVPENNDN